MNVQPRDSNRDSSKGMFIAPFEGLALSDLERVDNAVIKSTIERLKRSSSEGSRSRHNQHSSHNRASL